MNRQDIPVVILCGGKGYRLREETEHRPKTLIEIGEMPILCYIMKLHNHFGLSRFVLCLGYQGQRIKRWLLRYPDLASDFTMVMNSPGTRTYHNPVTENWAVTCADTGAETGTGGRLWRVRDYLKADTFMLAYGDVVADVDIDALLAFHFEQGRIGTVTGVHPISRYGELQVEGQRALKFSEKPINAEGVVSAGFFVFQREILDYLNDDPELYLEAAPLQKLANDGQLSVYLHERFWHPMDTYRDYLALGKLWNEGKAPWKLWQDERRA